MRKLFGIAIVLITVALPAFAQYRQWQQWNLSSDDQRRFDSYFSRWQDSRQRNDHDEREAGTLPYRAPRVPKILCERTHAVSLCCCRVVGRTVRSSEALPVSFASPLASGGDVLMGCTGDEIGDDASPERRGSVRVR